MPIWLRILIAAAVTAAILIALAYRRPLTKCPTCGEAQPRFRKPANKQEALFGGSTCKSCGVQMDKDGNPRGFN